MQYLFKYLLLLHAIIEEMPNVHPDKPRLCHTKEMMDKATLSKAENKEPEQVAAMEKQLCNVEVLVHAFTKEVVDWAKSVARLTEGFKDWVKAFSDVISLNGDSEAYDAFMKLKLLINLTTQPILLLDAMHSFEPFHHTLLNHNVAKGCPTPMLLKALTVYIVLHGQLHMELPAYIKLLHRGLACSTEVLAMWLVGFWVDIHE
ncbi:hypothetical protein EWM64_g7142 [Hericium alpestre]|uniref:Uncharacterized protein n=1 Tax=Hericium alpestre TaxID=135208 RepID=A0A4Y9ZTP4_9AGAM|nr:hypothetical protein EWM64_g7142 [Hericium alpestre]